METWMGFWTRVDEVLGKEEVYDAVADARCGADNNTVVVGAAVALEAGV